MKASSFHYKTLKEAPKDAELISHRLMIRANMIKPLASGIYSWMPLGLKILNNVESIIRKNMDEYGCLEVLMPMVQPKSLWDETKRSEQMGPELLGFVDRNKREFYLGPTHEEVITDICRQELQSHKDLPKTFYQIQTKFRDEIRPRFGVMRGREFLMKDAYSFDLNEEGMNKSYQAMKECYQKIFDEIGFDYKIVKADSGAIGGNMSEEFHVLADSGEDTLVFNDKDFSSNLELLEESLKREIEKKMDKNDLNQIDSIYGKLSIKKGIEVGHIFELGNKYSETMSLSVQHNNGQKILEMGCYGIGVSRIVAAAIEQNHDDKGIIFPKSISAFDCSLISINEKKSETVRKKAQQIYSFLIDNNIDVFYDDRDASPGIKFSDSNLMGNPYQIVISDKNIDKGLLEIIDRKDQAKSEIAEKDLLSLFD
jgi:prolyl-tRNA synthetase